MNTKYIYHRTLIYFTLILLVCTSCNATPNLGATQAAITDDTRAALAAGTLVGAQAIEQAAPELWAINQYLGRCPGCFMLFNNAQQVAIFVAPAGKTAAGATYYLAAVIDTAHIALVDANRTFVDFGIDSSKIRNLEEMVNALRARGFVEVGAASSSVLISTLRLALGFVKSLGTTISDVMIAPVFMLTNPMLLDQWQYEELPKQ